MRRARGFTLVELVLVIIITGIMAAALTVFFRPAIDGYFDTRRRAELGDMADTALRRIGRELRRAVPNSVIAHGENKDCIEFVLAKSGGLYRRDVDISNAGSDPLDSTAADASFDVLSPLAVAPVQGDFVVVGNQNTADVYTGATRAVVQDWQAPPPAPGGADVGSGRLTLKTAQQFPPAYDGGRFFVVAQAEQRVVFACRNAGEAAGNGTGALMRGVRNFDTTAPTACPTAEAMAGEAPLARRVAACSFDYRPGATEQSGYVSIRLQLLEAGERVTLVYGAHVSNVP